MDEETGYYYYGARYYNPRESVWLSTDLLQEKYPNISTYAYTFQNPIKYIDTDRKIGIPRTPAGYRVTEWFRKTYVTNYQNSKENGESTFRQLVIESDFG